MSMYQKVGDSLISSLLVFQGRLCHADTWNNTEMANISRVLTTSF
jgi:hypothetical protein